MLPGETQIGGSQNSEEKQVRPISSNTLFFLLLLQLMGRVPRIDRLIASFGPVLPSLSFLFSLTSEKKCYRGCRLQGSTYRVHAAGKM